MKMQRRVIDRRPPVAALALATLAMIACAKGSGPATGSGDNGSVTSVDPSAGTAPEQAPAPAPQVETPVTLPAPAVLQAVSTTQGKLDAITAVLEGTRVRFVDCAEGAACTARLEAQSLTGLRDLLRSVSAQQGGIGFTAREQLDGYAGRTFVADVTLGTAAARPVPTDENELLGN
jgi:hypothetical protein